MAVAGIAATALVGLSGTAVAWRSARDDRAAQRVLARDQQIAGHRVAAYVEAIDTLEGHISVLGNLDWSLVTPRGFNWEDVRVDDEADRTRIRSRIVAFGSQDAIAALHRVEVLDKKAFAWVLPDDETHRPRHTGPDLWRSNADHAIFNLRVGLDEFERRLNAELTS